MVIAQISQSVKLEKKSEEPLNFLNNKYVVTCMNDRAPHREFME